MDGNAIVQSVIKEIIQPGIQRLMESRYFSELREGKLFDEETTRMGDPTLFAQ